VAHPSDAPTPAPAADRPFPPGEYPVVVVGSGPGALQFSYALGRLGIDHAVVSADPSPGGMFRRWPFFQRLLSWTKPYAPAGRDTRAYERYDWNSLLSEEPALRAIQVGFMDGTSEFPARPEMEANLSAFAERAGIRVRYGCRWESTRREDGPDGERFVLVTSDGEYRCRAAVFAVGVAEPWLPDAPGMDLVAHYADTRPAETYANKRLFIVGKQNSGFELASGLLQWASRIILASPSPAKLSVNTHSLVGVRARYVQPFEDHNLGGGVSILDAALDRIERSGDAFRVHLHRSDNGAALSFEVDEVIAATGFVTPLRDLPDLGVTTFGQSKLPTMTPWWESTAVPGIHFAGTITQGSPGLKKHGIPPNSGAVHGHRYNGRVLARRLATTAFGVAPERPSLAAGDVLPFCLDELAGGPEIFHQRAYLARVITASPDDGIRDEGIAPLTTFLDDGGPDGLALTLEGDGTGAIYPAVYSRKAGRTAEHLLAPHPLLDFSTMEHRRQLMDILESLGVRG
jgi:thioredoxin reductase